MSFGYLVQRHSHGQPRRNLRNREAGRFRCQRRTARNARVHLDDHEPPRLRLDRELNVRSARLHADFANDRRRSVSHPLVFLVRQRLRRRHGDGIARVHAHGIEILDRAHHDEVVAIVAHHFQLEFLPTQHRFFHQRLVHGACIESARDRFCEFLAVVRDRAARPAQRERRPDHNRISQLVGQPQRVRDVVHQRRRRHFEADLPARILEPQPVFGHLDGAKRRPD